jgi:hypothetical protein
MKIMVTETFKYQTSTGIIDVIVTYSQADTDKMETSKIFFSGNELVDYLLEADFVIDLK